MTGKHARPRLGTVGGADGILPARKATHQDATLAQTPDITPTEVREAVMLATCMHELEHIGPPVVRKVAGNVGIEWGEQ